MKTLEIVICNCCKKVYYQYVEVCGNCGNEVSFTEIWTNTITEEDE